MCSCTGVADGCMPNCHGLGWAAHPAAASTVVPAAVSEAARQARSTALRVIVVNRTMSLQPLFGEDALGGRAWGSAPAAPAIPAPIRMTLSERAEPGVAPSANAAPPPLLPKPRRRRPIGRTLHQSPARRQLGAVPSAANILRQAVAQSSKAVV